MSSQPNSLSTGPRTAEGKARSSQNALKHGLAAGILIIPGENQADFDALLAGFLSDYQPEGQTETLIVHDIAKAYWLKDRAIRFQTIAFEITIPHLHKMAAPIDLPVLIRYQSANERTFYRAIKTLQDLQKQRKSAPKQFVSQKSPDTRQFVSQNGPPAPANDVEKVAKVLEAMQKTPITPAPPETTISIWKKYPRTEAAGRR
jgi:hypothetical protein